MRYEKARDLKEGDFKRLCGVKKETFIVMCEVVREVLSRETRGRKSGLSAEDQVLLTLGYWREYRTRVSFGARFRLTRIKCFADYSEGRKHFNQMREVFTAEQKTLVRRNRADLYNR